MVFLFFLLMGPMPVLAETLEEKFGSICAQVQSVESMSTEELMGLVSDSDALLEAFKDRNADKDKVYIMRLLQCRNFYDYMAEVKKKSPQ